MKNSENKIIDGKYGFYFSGKPLKVSLYMAHQKERQR